MFCEIPDFGRCCFCLPLRRGVLTFGYFNVLFSAFIIGIYSYNIHHGDSENFKLFYKGVDTDSLPGVCIAIYCVEILVNCLLVYGAHEKNILFLKVFYYYAISTTLAALVLQIVEFSRSWHVLEMAVITFTGLCIQLYLIFLVKSLLKRLEQGSSHAYDNQLHTIVLGETRTENGVYNNTTILPA